MMFILWMLSLIVVIIPLRIVRLFLLLMRLLVMPAIDFVPVWFALSLLRFRLFSILSIMFNFWIVVMMLLIIPSRIVLFFFSSRRRHTRFDCDWSSDVCSSD